MRDELIDLELFLWVQEGNSPDTFVYSGDVPSSFLEDFVSVYEAIIQTLEAKGHVAYGTTNLVKNSITNIVDIALAVADGKLTYSDVGKIFGSTLGLTLGVTTAAAAIDLLSILMSTTLATDIMAMIGLSSAFSPLLPFAILTLAGAYAGYVGAELGASYFTQFGNALENFLRPYQGSLSEKADWVNKLLAKFDFAKSTCSPLILDLDGDGIETTNLINSQTGEAGTEAVYWDIDNDGFREASAWVGKDDGLLARDVNGNGMIDDHSELFGSNTQNGFDSLKTYADSNNDNQITAADTNFNNLIVWQDANGDGVTQPGELKTLSELGITSISLSATALSGATNNDNPVSHHSTFVMNGQTRNVDDVWFKYDNANSIDTMPVSVR